MAPTTEQTTDKGCDLSMTPTSLATIDNPPATTRPNDPGSAIHHLRAAGVSVVLDCRGPRLPRIVHWGADLGALDPVTLENLVRADIQAVVTNVPDQPISPGIVAEHSTGWLGLPGLLGSSRRAGLVDACSRSPPWPPAPTVTARSG